MSSRVIMKMAMKTMGTNMMKNLMFMMTKETLITT